MSRLLERGESQTIGTQPLTVSLNWPGQGSVIGECFLLAGNDRVRDPGDRLHADNARAAGGAVIGVAGDETIRFTIDPVALPPEIQRVLFVAARDAGLAGPVILFCGPAGAPPAVRVTQPGDGAEAVIIAGLKRTGPGWQLEAIGQAMPSHAVLAAALGSPLDPSARAAAPPPPPPPPPAPPPPPPPAPPPPPPPPKPVPGGTVSSWIVTPGETPPPSGENLPLPIGIAVLPLPAMIQQGDLLAALKRLFPHDFEKCEIRPGTMPGGLAGQSLLVLLPDRNLTVLNLPTPLPDGVLDVAAAKASAAGWAEIGDIAAGHRGHVVVSCVHKARAGAVADWPGHRLAFARTAQLLAAIGDVLKAPALYWGAAEHLHKPVPYAALARAAALRLTPAELWIDLTIGRPVEGQVVVATQGLAALLGAEIMTQPIALDVERVAAAVNGVIALLLDQGPVLKEGQILDNAYGDKIEVRHDMATGRPAWRLAIHPRRR